MAQRFHVDDDQESDFNQPHATSQGPEMNNKLIQHLIQENHKKIREERFRFDEFDYSLVLKCDIAMTIVQFFASVIFMGSWFTFVLVRLPRLAMSIVSSKFFHKISSSERKLKFLKYEWQVRAATVLLYILLSLGFSVWLPSQFCKLFSGIFYQLGRTTSQAQACQWQIFGFRLTFMVLYFPIDVMLFFVTYRHTRDLSFQISLKQAIFKGESELQQLSVAQKRQTEPFKAMTYLRASQDSKILSNDLDDNSFAYDSNITQRRFLNEDFSMRQGPSGRNANGAFLPPISGMAASNARGGGRLELDEEMIYNEADYDSEEYDDESGTDSDEEAQQKIEEAQLRAATKASIDESRRDAERQRQAQLSLVDEYGNTDLVHQSSLQSAKEISLAVGSNARAAEEDGQDEILDAPQTVQAPTGLVAPEKDAEKDADNESLQDESEDGDHDGDLAAVEVMSGRKKNKAKREESSEEEDGGTPEAKPRSDFISNEQDQEAQVLPQESVGHAEELE